MQFHFESETYFIQENLESATLEIIKEGSNDIPVTVVVETQSLEAKGQYTQSDNRATSAV